MVVKEEQERGDGGERKWRGIWKEGGSPERKVWAWKLGSRFRAREQETDGAAQATATGRQRAASSQSCRTNEAFGELRLHGG